VEVSEIEHTHEASLPLEAQLLLTDETKKFIQDNFMDGKTPSVIRNKFQDVKPNQYFIF
jgi:hypothetical protein